MHNSVDKLNLIKKEILTSSNNNVNIIAVSKTFPINDIYPLINDGHIHFGENKIQEAIEKWSDIKKDFPHIKLHMVGKLQTNKVKYVIPFFDYIHSLDNLKLAEKISNEQSKKKKSPKIFIQVNIGDESQKSGITIERIEEFFNTCIQDLNLNIVGLMCLPPNNTKPDLYFDKMQKLINKLPLQELSMGMSSDYINAIKYGSTFVRIGSKIFGDRS
jgi:pyridoxal phosphate enzyme (YggS family)